MKKLVALMVALTMVLGLASVASAAEYPSKGISVICPWVPAAERMLFSAPSVRRWARIWALR